MAGIFQPIQKKKRSWLLIAIPLAFLVIAILAFFQFLGKEEAKIPTLTVETPQKISLSEGGEFTLDVTVSSLGTNLYPAASMSISFDPSRLEFIGIEEGNLPVSDDESESGRRLPEWSCNVQNSNITGSINILYLDMTGGKYAFSSDLFSEAENVVLRLVFRLRGSVGSGEVLDLIFEDAVFAASNEKKSLAMTTNTLKTRNGRIVIGE